LIARKIGDLMNKTIKINNIEAKPGEKKCGFLKIGETATRSLEMPLVIINGKNDGPILCLTAGTHGCEYPGIAAVIRVLKETNPEKLSGAILGVPIINMDCFENRRPYLVGPVPFGSEYLALREAQPDPFGMLGARLRHVLMNDVVNKADMRIDCHGGDFDERLNPNTYFREIGDEKHDETSKILSRIYGFRYVIQQPTRTMQPGEKNVPSIVAECGGIKTLLESDVVQHVEGMRNVMKFFKMIEGRPRIRVKQLYVKEFCSMVRVEKGGFFVPKIDVGDKVSKGQIVGEIWNIWGDLLETLGSPCDGIVRKMYSNHAASTGEPLIQIMKSPEPVPPFPLTDPYIELDEYDQTSKIYV